MTLHSALRTIMVFVMINHLKLTLMVLRCRYLQVELCVPSVWWQMGLDVTSRFVPKRWVKNELYYLNNAVHQQCTWPHLILKTNMLMSTQMGASIFDTNTTWTLDEKMTTAWKLEMTLALRRALLCARIKMEPLNSIPNKFIVPGLWVFWMFRTTWNRN